VDVRQFANDGHGLVMKAGAVRRVAPVPPIVALALICSASGKGLLCPIQHRRNLR
jgi:hypothetical protein